MSYSCSVPILMIFFNRPDSFKQVFEKVREAKPKTLILAQDGPRNKSDIPGIEACRKVVENIDWECNVIREYSEVNLGCGVRPKSAIDFALERLYNSYINLLKIIIFKMKLICTKYRKEVKNMKKKLV